MAKPRSISDAIAAAITQRKHDIIVALAEFLTTDVARKSIELQMGKPDAKAWAKISNLLGGSGYDTKEQRITLLTDLFS